MLTIAFTFGAMAAAMPQLPAGPILTISGSGPTMIGAPVLTGQFSRLAGVRELSDGSVLLIDREERAILYLARTGNAAATVGRDGSGPGEYTAPTLIVPMTGDSTAVFDQRQWRWVFLAGNKMLTRTLNFPAAATEQYRGFDQQGRLYYEGSENVGTAPDSLAILRLDPTSGISDTVARIKLPKPRPLGETGGAIVGGMPGPFSRYGPYAPRDDWAVTGDGAIVLARVSPYRIERLSNGKTERGPIIADAPRRLDQRHKDAWNARYGRMKLFVPDESGKQRQIVPKSDIKWPEYLPPFEPKAVRLAPDGSIWVMQTGDGEGSSERIDVMDAAGTKMGSIVVQPGLRLLGLGPKAIYLVSEDEDGLQTLVRQNVTWPTRH